jgi:hypothetical protein
LVFGRFRFRFFSSSFLLIGFSFGIGFGFGVAVSIFPGDGCGLFRWFGCCALSTLNLSFLGFIIRCFV